MKKCPYCHQETKEQEFTPLKGFEDLLYNLHFATKQLSKDIPIDPAHIEQIRKNTETYAMAMKIGFSRVE